MRLRIVLLPLAAAALLLAGCVTVPAGAPPGSPGARPRPEAPSLGWFSRIKVPDGHEPALRLAARGVQIFRCERIGTQYDWRFRLPEAELFDEQGRPVGRHGANFTFEHRDGSRLVGTIVANEKAPAESDLLWLLFSARGYGKGEFSGVSYVQRVNTKGGMPPRDCSATEMNRLLRVEFSADFVFYRPRG